MEPDFQGQNTEAMTGASFGFSTYTSDHSVGTLSSRTDFHAFEVQTMAAVVLGLYPVPTGRSAPIMSCQRGEAGYWLAIGASTTYPAYQLLVRFLGMWRSSLSYIHAKELTINMLDTL